MINTMNGMLHLFLTPRDHVNGASSTKKSKKDQVPVEIDWKGEGGDRVTWLALGTLGGKRWGSLCLNTSAKILPGRGKVWGNRREKLKLCERRVEGKGKRSPLSFG